MSSIGNKRSVEQQCDEPSIKRHKVDNKLVDKVKAVSSQYDIISHVPHSVSSMDDNYKALLPVLAAIRTCQHVSQVGREVAAFRRRIGHLVNEIKTDAEAGVTDQRKIDRLTELKSQEAAIDEAFKPVEEKVCGDLHDALSDAFPNDVLRIRGNLVFGGKVQQERPLIEADEDEEERDGSEDEEDLD